MNDVAIVRPLAPDDDTVVEYDRRNLALYAALLEADDAGDPWKQAASSVLRIDLRKNGAEACWRSHLDRARWIVGDGLEGALVAFDKPGRTRRIR